ncbi:alkaline phosphatase family protein [Gleimia hominis]|uniref:alkaline phosphatase family protein n=1 Tax=Gleimia hominis TaxID=595468 RepID=UPI000C806312|nr:alkaline phosphatase family protein [Gleimia hominis]WIK64718.1 alkaline phosphatase family protein [Gleimia hominis]
MKLLLICLDGVRADYALPDFMEENPLFKTPDHPADPRFSSGGKDHTLPPQERPKNLARTLNRLGRGDEHSEGKVIPMWMTPPTDSGPGWSTIITGATHEECNVWWNEFVGHELAKTPDILSRVFFANPKARTLAACTWDAFTVGSGPGPMIHQRVDQQRTGQHKVFHPDVSNGVPAADASVIQWATWHLLHEGPDAAVVYLEGVDAAGHAHGAESEQYRDAISQVDEWVRYLIKAVAERYEQLGEEWLVAVTTDHGHKPEGGHGEDEVEVRRSFLITHMIGGQLPQVIRDKEVLHSHEVMWLLLDAMGVKSGSYDAPGVGELQDIETVGPTRNLDFEW